MDAHPDFPSPYRWMIVIGLGMVLLGIAIVPIWSVRIPPLVDYPNHLARMHVLTSTHDSPLLSQYYEIRWAVLPNLGMDILVPPLVKLVPIETAGKIFLSLVCFVLVGGVVVLHRVVHNRWSLWPLLAILFLYNTVFLWGFLNYLLGLGLGLWVFAAWLLWRDQPASRLIPIFSCLACVLFFSHLFALGTYAIAVSAYELREVWDRRQRMRDHALPRLATALAPFALPCVLMMFSPLLDSDPAHVPSWLKHTPSPHRIERSSVAVTIDAFKGTLRTEHLLANSLTAGALLSLLIFGLITKRLHFASSLSWTVGALTLAALVTPTNIGTASYVEIRLPLAVMLYGLASLDFRLVNRSWVTAITVCFIGILLLRTAVITEHWVTADRQYDEFVHAAEALPAGSRIFSAMRKNDSWDEVAARRPSPIPTQNLVCWAVITRSAFVSMIFSAPNQQPLVLAAPYRSYFSTGEYVAGKNIDWEAVDWQYEYLLVRNKDRFYPPIPQSAIRVFAGTHFTIYRLSGSPASSLG
jgi:hypothetical protein